MKKFALGFILLLVLFSILVPLSKVNIVKAESTIYIRADGSVEGTDKIQRDGNVYAFTGDISIDSGDCGIEVDRDNIVIDGAGFTLQGTAAYISRGIDLSSRSNVTVKNMEIRNFMDGIYLVPSSNNTITGNYITANTDSGIWTAGVSNNITGNHIANNNIGILFEGSHDLIYHNNFINNTKQVEDMCWTNPWLPSSANILDDGYPSGGNYWSDYEGRYPNATELDDSGIWNTQYIIDENNQDNYPLMNIIPEFPTWTSMLFILIVLTIAIATYKRKQL
jgi:parallel beta-helix repeat protein